LRFSSGTSGGEGPARDQLIQVYLEKMAK